MVKSYKGDSKLKSVDEGGRGGDREGEEPLEESKQRASKMGIN